MGPRTNMKKVSKKDFTSVDIVGTCKYLESPPQPLSLRLSSNLMVGVTRIYGQQWSVYWGDVSSLAGCITGQEKGKQRSVDMPIKKADYEEITLQKTADINLAIEDQLMSLNFSDFDLDNLAAINRTPEHGRRASLLGGSTTSKSIDLPRGLGSLSKEMSSGNDSFGGGNLSFGGSFGPMVDPGGALDFGAADFPDMNDFDNFVPSGPEESGSLEESLRRLSSGSGSLNMEEILDQFDGEQAVVPQVPKRKRAAKRQVKLGNLVDEETTLTKEQLMLDDGEGLVNLDLLRKHEDWSSLFSEPLAFDQVNPTVSSLWKKPEPEPESAPMLSERDELRLSNVHMDYDYDIDGPVMEPLPFDAFGSETIGSNMAAMDFGSASVVSEQKGSVRSQASRAAPTQKEDFAFQKKINDHLVGRDSCSFDALLDGRHTRKSVAAAFYNVLVMACSGAIRVRQEGPFRKIVLC